jgi:hypothetical protein
MEEAVVPDRLGLLVRGSCGVRIGASNTDLSDGADECGGRTRSPILGSLVPELALEKATDGEAVAV